MTLNKKQQKALRADYESNKHSNAALAQIYGIGARSVARLAQRNGWQRAGLSKKVKNCGVPFTPTEAQKAEVELLASQGCPAETMAFVIGCGVHTLVSAFADQIAHGTHLAAARLGGVLYRRAMGTPAVLDSDGDVVQDAVPPDFASAAFWLRCRGGWAQKVESLNVKVEPGPSWSALIGNSTSDDD